MNNQCAIFSTAYFPPIGYFKALSRHGGHGLLLLEAHENYRKQSWRNRCNILSANGELSLSIPVTVGEDRSIRSVLIDYSKDWLRQHQRALVSAYNSTPFFEYYQDDIFAVMESGETHLFDFNLNIIRCVARLAGLRLDLRLTEAYIDMRQVEAVQTVHKEQAGQDNQAGQVACLSSILDLRATFDPKKKELSAAYATAPYYQVFSEKFGFVPDLSILDLLFNEGPNSYSFL